MRRELADELHVHVTVCIRVLIKQRVVIGLLVVVLWWWLDPTLVHQLGAKISIVLLFEPVH